MDTVRIIFEDLDHEAEERAWAEGEADADAGRVVPNEDIKGWLGSWGTDHNIPLPECPGE